MSAPASRRGFLRGLTTLPLIGGSVALIGSPSAAAVPVTPGMIATYVSWLDQERAFIGWATNTRGFTPCMTPGWAFHDWERRIEKAALNAIKRAPVMLAAAGCALTSVDAEGYRCYAPENWLEGVRCQR